MKTDDFPYREYFILLRRRWGFLLALAVVAMLTAGVATSLQPPPVYQATTVVWTSHPTSVELAQSDEVLTAVDDALGATSAPVTSRTSFHAVRGSDSVTLSVTDANSVEAAALANAWADALVEAVLESAGNSVLYILQAELDATTLEYTEAVQRYQELSRWLSDAELFRERLAARPADEPGSPQDETLLYVFAARLTPLVDPVIQVEIGATSSPRTVGEQLVSAEQILAGLTARQAQLKQSQDELRASIADVQVRLARAQSEARGVAATLATAYVVEYAEVPSTPLVERNLLSNVLLAGALGLMVGVFVVLGFEYFRGGLPVMQRSGDGQPDGNEEVGLLQ